MRPKTLSGLGVLGRILNPKLAMALCLSLGLGFRVSCLAEMCGFEFRVVSGSPTRYFRCKPQRP